MRAMTILLVAVELMAVAAVVFGVALWSVPAAFIVGGVAVIAMIEQRAG